MTNWLVVDVSNILFRVWAAQGKDNDPDEHLGLCMHSSFMTIRKWYNKFKPDKLVFAFEGGNNWRKTYMAKPEAVSKIGYKANRVYDPSMKTLFELIGDFKELMGKHSAVACLSVDECEGDDVIAGFVQMYAGKDTKITVLSGDKDFTQLIKYTNVTLIDPATGLDRSIDKKTGDIVDPDFYIFEKCFRGDAGDGVASAYPRILKTKIRKAFEDEAFRINILNEVLEGPHGSYKVGDKFEENRLLMDLEAQPDEIKAKMYEQIEAEINNSGSYSHFHFLRFCGKYKLKAIGENIASFVDMFSANQKAAKTNSLLVE